MSNFLFLKMPGSLAYQKRLRRAFHTAFIASIFIMGTALFLGAACLQAADAYSTPAKKTLEEPGGRSALAKKLGIEFVAGSTSSVVFERGGKRYVADLLARSVQEVDHSSSRSPAGSEEPPKSSTPDTSRGKRIFAETCSPCHGIDGKGVRTLGTPDFTSRTVQASLTDKEMVEIIRNGKKGTAMPAWDGKLTDEDIRAVTSYLRSLARTTNAYAGEERLTPERKSRVYEPPDDYVFTLPTGRRLERHGVYVNFTHRFAFDPAFSGKARGHALAGLDGFGIASFGLRYGITDRFSVSVYRSPSVIGRPIEFMAAYNFLDERDGNPLNGSLRVSVDGQNDFSRNFTTNLEGIFSRSLLRRAQIYVVPTLSLQNRRLIVNPVLVDPPPDLPGINSFSLGVGGALDIRPSVALVAEVIPTLVNGRALGIHRPAYAFGIQKRLWRHAFTLGFSNSPGTVVSQRAGTRATFLGDPSADTPSGLFIGFDLMRQVY